MNWLHAASCRLVARPWLGVIRLTDKSSTAMRSKVVARRRPWWWAKSPRRQVMRAGTRATTRRLLARSGVPCSSCERRRGALAIAVSSTRKKRGLALSVPVARVANVCRPTSIPTGKPVVGSGTGSAHAHEQPTYHVPVLLRLIVAVLGTPSLGRCRTTFTCPTLAMRRRFVSASRVQPSPGCSLVQGAACWNLREGEAVLALRAAKAWRAWRLASRHTAKERLKRPGNAHGNVLPHRRRDHRQRGAFRLQHGQRRRLVLAAQRLLALVPRGRAFFQQVVRAPAALFPLLDQEPRLWLVRVHAVLERLTPVGSRGLKRACCQ